MRKDDNGMLRRYLIAFTILFLVGCLFLVGGCSEPTDEGVGDNQVEDVTTVTIKNSTLTWVKGPFNGTRVQYRTFYSSAAQAEVSYHIYTPELYDTDEERNYPVLYWLHGTGGGETGTAIAWLSDYFNNAINSGKIPPIIVIFPYGMMNSMWVDSYDGSIPMETVIVKELVPHIDETYRTITSPEGRLIEGFSMGGYGSARLGFKYHDVFGAISILGAGPVQERLIETPRATPEEREALLENIYGGDMEYFVAVSPRKMAEKNAADLQKNNIIIRLVVGDIDETYKHNHEFHEYLTQLDIPHDFTVLPGVEHDSLKYYCAMGENNLKFYSTVFGEGMLRSQLYL